MEGKTDSDLKKIYQELWTGEYETAWRTNGSSLGFGLGRPVPEELSDSEGQKKDFVHHLMLCSIFNYLNEQRAKLGEVQAKLAEAERKLLALQITKSVQDCDGQDEPRSTSLNSPLQILSPKGETFFETSEEEVSQSLYSHKSRRSPKKSPKKYSPVKSKENRPGTETSITSMPPPMKQAQKGKSNWINASRSKNTFLASTPLRNSNKEAGTSRNLNKEAGVSRNLNKEAGVSRNLNKEAGTSSSKLRRPKRLVQTRLDLNSFGEKVKQEDLTCLEEYLGGVRVEMTEDFGTGFKRKIREDVEEGNQSPEGSQILFQSPEKIRLDIPVQVKVEAKTPENERMDLEGIDFEETFFETPNKDLERQVHSEALGRNAGVGQDTMQIIESFDKLPGDGKPSPAFKYKPDKAIRKRDERNKLEGVACDMCRKYYEDIASQLNEAEIDRIINKCSRHRVKYAARAYDTPPDFWRTDFPSTPEMISRGQIHVESVDTTVDPKRRHRI